MKKIGITGSIASGKTTASKILSKNYGPLFSADKEVRKLYKSESFKIFIRKKLKINNNINLKQNLKKIILTNKNYIKKLEKIIHPLIRKKMKKFTSQNKSKKFLFYEIPLLIESKLMKYFDIIIFIKAKKKVRFKRFKSKKGDQKLFILLNNKQLKDKNKIKFCNHVVVNEKKLNILKKNLLAIMRNYE